MALSGGDINFREESYWAMHEEIKDCDGGTEYPWQDAKSFSQMATLAKLGDKITVYQVAANEHVASVCVRWYD